MGKALSHVVPHALTLVLPEAAVAAGGAVRLGLYPIVTSQYSSITLYQFSYHIQWLFFSF